MTPLEIHYRPFPTLKFIRKIHTSYPDSWKELTPSQFISASCVFKESITDGILNDLPELVNQNFYPNLLHACIVIANLKNPVLLIDPK